MGRLVLLRHGESLWNRERRFAGSVDVPLTERGREEARYAGRRLRSTPIDVVYTSLLTRAANTVKLVLAELPEGPIRVVRDAALNESRYGVLEGLDRREAKRRFGKEKLAAWRTCYDLAPPGGESVRDTAARTLPFFRAEIRPQLDAGRCVLICAHGNSLRAIVMEVEGLDAQQVMTVRIPNAVPIVYTLDAAGAISDRQVLSQGGER